MFETQIWQYGLVGLALATLFALKTYIVRKQYSRDLHQYANPAIFLEEVKKKVTTAEQAEQIILVTINGALNGDRMRNISILVALINQCGYVPKKLKSLRQKVEKVEDLDSTGTLYQRYILDNIKEW